jgi:hypothetical protein
MAPAGGLRDIDITLSDAMPPGLLVAPAFDALRPARDIPRDAFDLDIKYSEVIGDQPAQGPLLGVSGPFGITCGHTCGVLSGCPSGGGGACCPTAAPTCSHTCGVLSGCPSGGGGACCPGPGDDDDDDDDDDA